ncbi:MAG: hypothetical protein AAFQ83_26670, partial [Bacteroidota bacterium]
MNLAYGEGLKNKTLFGTMNINQASMRSLLLLIFCLSGYLSAQVSGIFPIRSPYSYKYKLSTSQAEQFLRYQEPVRLSDLDAPL